ncbi:MAG: ROK family protein [Bacteroidota bacterium]
MSARLIILLDATHTHYFQSPKASIEVPEEVSSVPNEEMASWIQEMVQQDLSQVVICAELDVLYSENSHVHAVKEAFQAAGAKVHTLHLAQALAHQYIADKGNILSQNMIVLYAGDSLLFSTISGGRVIRGQHLIAGNLGESLLKNPGLEGNTFQTEPLKNFVSTKGIQRVAGSLIPLFQGKSTLMGQSISSLTVEELVKACNSGDKLAKDIIEETGKILGMKLADLMSTASPDHILIHGPLAELGTPFSESTQQSLEKNVLSIFRDKVKIKLDAESLPEKVLKGGAVFASQQELAIS